MVRAAAHRPVPTSCPASSAQLRAADGVAGTTAYVTGPAGLFADFAGGFSGIDGVLLLAAFGVVLLILLVVYRSPMLPFLVHRHGRPRAHRRNGGRLPAGQGGLIAVNGQSQGISAILVVGAATDYGLLLVARYREELRAGGATASSPCAVALRAAVGPIVACGATVILGVLCLLLLRPGSNRGLGPISAVSVALAVRRRAHLPARGPVLLGRAAFWPFRPAVRQRAPARPRLGRVAATVGAGTRPGCWSGACVGLFVAACFAPTFAAAASR